MMNGFLCGLTLMIGLAVAQDPASPAVPPAARKPDASDEFFQKGTIPELRIQVSVAELEKLKADNRTYVRCTIVENRRVTYQDVAIKLKGAAGSFREWHDRPALTLNSDKFTPGQSFHGLDKFHLNNSVQDETYTHEWLCEELCRSAGIPATRVTHARVWLNDRDVGLYVLKEGFDRTFLKRHYKDPDGNLYDGGFVRDIDAELEKDAGKGPDDRSDLKALLDACRDPDPEKRWKRLEELLDIDAFLSFVAMELMTCHWDGYSVNRNNYRIYFHPTDQRAHFLLHGMDQMIGDPGFPILDNPGAIVSSTVMQNPAWRFRYRDRVRKLLPLFAPPEKLQARVEHLRQRLQPVLAAMDPQAARHHADRVREFQDRIAARAASLKEQIERGDPRPAEFDERGNLHLADWKAMSETDDAVLEEVELPGEKKAYSILCGPGGRCVASWRRTIRLARGTYTLHANVQTRDVAGIEDDRGVAAGLRISGATRTNTLKGTSAWKPVAFEFVVEEESREVVLVAELRTTHGQAWFEKESLRLSRKSIAGK